MELISIVSIKISSNDVSHYCYHSTTLAALNTQLQLFILFLQGRAKAKAKQAHQTMGGGVGEAAAAARGGRTGHKCKTCKPKYAEADLSLLFSPYIFFHISRHNVVVDDDAVVGTKFDAAFFNSLSLSLSLILAHSFLPSFVVRVLFCTTQLTSLPNFPSWVYKGRKVE